MKDSQQILKSKNKIIIIADYREKEVSEHLKNLGAKVNELNLKVGEFICSEQVGVERKTHSDFVSSIIDGRIFEQAEDLKNNFKKPVLILEGYSNRQINDNALKGAVACLVVDFGIAMVSTKNPLDTAKTIYWIAKREQTEKKHGIFLKTGKKQKEEKRLKEQIVASLPGVSSVISRRLLERFGSVENVFCASESELMKVKGVGKKLAEKIRKILSEKW